MRTTEEETFNSIWRNQGGPNPTKGTNIHEQAGAQSVLGRLQLQSLKWHHYRKWGGLCPPKFILPSRSHHLRPLPSLSFLQWKKFLQDALPPRCTPLTISTNLHILFHYKHGTWSPYLKLNRKYSNPFNRKGSKTHQHLHQDQNDHTHACIHTHSEVFCPCYYSHRRKMFPQLLNLLSTLNGTIKVLCEQQWAPTLQFQSR